MSVYMGANDPLHLDPTNLMAMRGDLHREQFDQSGFAIVPKCGELRVHFLKNVRDSGNYYHNTLFDNNHVSRELLFARFALQVFRLNHLSNFRAGDTRSGGCRGDHGGEGDGGGGIGGDSGRGDNGSTRTRGQKRSRTGKMKEESELVDGRGVKKARRKEKNDDDNEMEIENELDTDAEQGLYPCHLIECGF
jgi:hypothetical protein